MKALAPQHPEWATKEPFASLLKGDTAKVLAAGGKGVAEIMAVTHAGMTTDEFAPLVEQWIASAKHPQTGRLYTDMVYRPMVELLAYRAPTGSRPSSLGRRRRVHAWVAERIYGIPPEQVIGSVGKLKFEMREGTPVLIKLPEIDFIDDKEGKPSRFRPDGRRPIARSATLWRPANAAVDNGRQRCEGLTLVVHTDAAREFATSGPSGSSSSKILGRGREGLDGRQMKDDWRTVFPVK